MATSKPIALPTNSNSSSSSDYTMGSYSADANGNFNPASYTRHFLGSPISWRAGSFGGRFPQGSPTAQLLSSIENTKMSSSIDNDRGSIVNALTVFDMDAELCRNYNCCGLQLHDLHALLEHFEEVHILVAEPGPPQIQVPFNPQPINSQIAQQQHSHQHQSHQQPHQNHLRHQQQTFDTDDMELELDLDNSTHPTPSATNSSSPSSGGTSPPHTPVSAPLSAYPSPIAGASSALSYLQPQSQYTAHSQQYAQYQATPYTSAHASPYTSQPPSPGSTPSNQSSTNNGTAHSAVHMHSHLSQAGHYQNNGPNVLTHPEEAFNPYARFAADYSSHMPGTQFNGSGGEEIVVGQNGVVAGSEYGVGVVNGTVGEFGQYMGQMGGITGQGQQGQQCIPPALLFASTGERESPREAREGSEGARVPSPPAHNNPAKLKLKVRGGASTSDPNSRASSSASTPAPTPIQATNPTPAHTPSHTPAPVPTSSLLLSKPFRCPKPNCNKSYKQANGLKYHMTHGSCNFAPPKDLEHVKDLLERKRREREANGTGAGAGAMLNAVGGAALSRSASLGSLGSGADVAGASSSALTGAGGEPFLQNMPHSAYGDLGSITETELREVEREAERRVRPFACGVGDCQRRYKNMNGLRYHYQHSGDHGAVGLALLAGGLHECLSGANGAVGGGGGEGKGKGKGMGGVDEREGRRRALHRTAGAAGIRGGSASVPVSRAGSVVGVSRVGTPVGYASGTATPYTSTTGATTPFSPGATTPFSPAATTPFSPGYTAGVGANSNTTPPLTPLTAAVQGLGLGEGSQGQVRSHSHSPTANGAQMYAQQQQGSPQMQQQQQQQHPTGQQQHQLAYQAQFVELQRRQYMQAQAQAQAQAAQQQAFGQQQQEPTFVQHHHQQDFVDAHVQAQQAQAQQDFVDAAQRDFEAQMVQAQHVQQQQRDFQAQQHQHQQRQFGSVDMSMS